MKYLRQYQVSADLILGAKSLLDLAIFYLILYPILFPKKYPCYLQKEIKFQL